MIFTIDDMNVFYKTIQRILKEMKELNNTNQSGTNIPSDPGVTNYPLQTVTGSTTNVTKTTPGSGTRAGETFWETDIEIDTKAVDVDPVDVKITSVASMKINILMRKFPHMEWLAYLVGDKETNTITDIVIPKQKVTVVNVFVKGHVDVPTIGVIHSHHDMGNRFSHTDDEYINANHDISLCISKQGIAGQVRIRKDETTYVLAEANVIESDDLFNFNAFDKEIEDNISEMTYTYRSYGNVSGSSNNILDAYYDDVMDDVFPNVPVTAYGGERKNITGYVDEYMREIKGYITTGAIDDMVMDEMYYLYELIHVLGTDEWEKKQDEMYDGVVVLSVSAIDVIDEIDIHRDELKNPDLIKINDLYQFIEDYLTSVGYFVDDSEANDNEDNQ